MKIEKIKRYEIDGLKAYIDCKDPKFKLADFEEPYGDLCFYNDHKQILDSMHNLLTEMAQIVRDAYLNDTYDCECPRKLVNGSYESGSYEEEIDHEENCIVEIAYTLLQDTKPVKDCMDQYSEYMQDTKEK